MGPYQLFPAPPTHASACVGTVGRCYALQHVALWYMWCVYRLYRVLRLWDAYVLYSLWRICVVYMGE